MQRYDETLTHVAEVGNRGSMHYTKAYGTSWEDAERKGCEAAERIESKHPAAGPQNVNVRPTLYKERFVELIDEETAEFMFGYD